jgi:hypothetical protein
MTKVPKPDLDEATTEIARRMFGTPPKPHEEMKVGKRPAKTRPGKTSSERRSRAKSPRD